MNSRLGQSFGDDGRLLKLNTEAKMDDGVQKAFARTSAEAI